MRGANSSQPRVGCQFRTGHAALGLLYLAQKIESGQGEFTPGPAIDPHDETSRKALEQLQGAGH